MSDYMNSENPKYIPRRNKRFSPIRQERLKEIEEEQVKETKEVIKRKFGDDGLKALERLDYK